MTDHPPRLSTPEVCALARYGRATLWKRIDAGLMPRPIDRGGDGYLFDLRAVMAALGLDGQHEAVETGRENAVPDPEAYRATLAREVRRRKGAGWRDRQGVLPGSRTPPTLRLVGVDPAP
jgi:predicted DNA-binding transcriptional regulator AlpA